MTMLAGLLRRHAARVVALVAIGALYGLTRLPTPSSAEREALAARFEFSSHALAVPDGPEPRDQRPVHPSFRRHVAWISAVGGAVTLTDLDGNGLPDDVVHVDTATDRVIVGPAPGTGARYAAFALEAAPLPYDARTTAPMGSVAGDFNEDGRIDLVVYYWGRSPVAFLRRGGDDAGAGASRDRYAAVELGSGERWNTNAMTSADVDGDGHLDLVIGNYFQDGARLLDELADGTEQMQDSMSRAFNGGRNRVLRWTGGTAGVEPDVRFDELNDVFDDDVAGAWTLAIGAADLDGDLLPELYFANDFGPDRLLHNRSTPGHPAFAVLRGPKMVNAPNSKALGRDSFKGMGCDFGDINGDGVLDIYVSNIADEYALEESHFVWTSRGSTDAMRDGVAPYVDCSEPLGLSRSSWGWDTRFGDFDNDGVLEAVQATGFVKGGTDRWPELHELAMGNDDLLRSPASWPDFGLGDDLSGHAHNPFFVRSASGRYVDIATDLGLGEPHVTRGISTADVDGDGDLDFAIGNQWETSYLIRNLREADGHAFLGLNLLLPVDGASGVEVAAGHAAGRPAVGAAVTVTLPDGRRLVGHVDGGNGHSGVRSHQVHFGLGPAADSVAVPVAIRWRDGNGATHATTIELAPGWHTVTLGAPNDGEVRP